MAHESCDENCPHDEPGWWRCFCKCEDCGGPDHCKCEFCKLINPAKED